MTENRIEPGDVRVLTVTVCDRDGTPGDPTDLTFTMNEPSGTVTTYQWKTDDELVRDDDGVFHVAWPITQTGTHRYAFHSTGTNAAYEEGSFVAQPRRVATT